MIVKIDGENKAVDLALLKDLQGSIVVLDVKNELYEVEISDGMLNDLKEMQESMED